MLRRIINLTRLINHVTKNSTNKNNKRRAHQVCGAILFDRMTGLDGLDEHGKRY